MEVRKFEAGGAESGFSKNERKGRGEVLYEGEEEKGPRPFPSPLPSAADYFALAGLVRINLIASRAELSRQDSRWL